MKESSFNKIVNWLDTDRTMDQRITDKLMKYDESSENLQAKNPVNFTANLFGRLLTNRLAKAAVIVIAVGILGTATVMASRYYVKSYKVDYVDPESRKSTKDISSPTDFNSSDAAARGAEAFANLGLPNLIPAYLFDNYKLEKEHFNYTESTTPDGTVKKSITGDFINEDKSKNVYLEFTPLTTSVKEMSFEVHGLETSTYTTGNGLICNLEIDKKNETVNVNIIYDSTEIGNAYYLINFNHFPLEEVKTILDSIPINAADVLVTSYTIDYSSDTKQTDRELPKRAYVFAGEVSDSPSAKYGDQVFSELELPNLLPSYLYDNYNMDQEDFIVSEEQSPDGTMGKKITAEFYTADQSKSVNIQYIPSADSVKKTQLSENDLMHPADKYIINVADDHPDRAKEEYVSKNGVPYNLEIDKESGLIESSLLFDSSALGNAEYFITFQHVPMEEVKEILDSIPISNNNLSIAYYIYYYNNSIPEPLEKNVTSYGETIFGTIDYNNTDDVKYGDEAFAALGLPNLIPILLYDNYYLEQEHFHVIEETYPGDFISKEIAAGFCTSDFSKRVDIYYYKTENSTKDTDMPMLNPENERITYTTESGLICNMEIDKKMDAILTNISFDSDVIGNANYFIDFYKIPLEEAKEILESLPIAGVKQ